MIFLAFIICFIFNLMNLILQSPNVCTWLVPLMKASKMSILMQEITDSGETTSRGHFKEAKKGWCEEATCVEENFLETEII